MLTGDRAQTAELQLRIEQRIEQRDAVFRDFFEGEALALSRACSAMAERFANGGRLLAYGSDAYATDAMHLSVEFIHPVIVGKRALPALDISMESAAWASALCAPQDMLAALGPPQAQPFQDAAFQTARSRGTMTLALPGDNGDYAVRAPSRDPHIHQELFELLGHTMYESVHVFLEHSDRRRTADAARPQEDPTGFLYPFLAQSAGMGGLVEDVASSIVAKMRDAQALREAVRENSEPIAAAVMRIRERLNRGGRILAFGNGGSATDACDFALDCIMPQPGQPPIAAISLALEPAVITATANDVGTDLIFVRQLIAQATADDVALAFSTSGGSANIVAGLQAARERGLLTVALLGYDGGAVVRKGLADVALVVPCDYIPRIQEAQGTIYHVIREALSW